LFSIRQLPRSQLFPYTTLFRSQLDANQLAIWISAAPDPQRTALALFYLDEFTHEELLMLTELKIPELAKWIGNARQEFQAWLNRSEEHTSELQSQSNLVCRLLL